MNYVKNSAFTKAPIIFHLIGPKMKKYKVLQNHYENCFRKHGATAKGMDWPNQNDLKRRFNVLTDIITPNGKNDSKIKILDLGCGVGLLIDYLDEIDKLNNIDYFGIDISEKMVDFANEKYAKYNFEYLKCFTYKFWS